LFSNKHLVNSMVEVLNMDEIRRQLGPSEVKRMMPEVRVREMEVKPAIYREMPYWAPREQRVELELFSF